MTKPISSIKLGLARGAGAISRASGRGGGTSLPGKVLLELQDDAIARLGSRLRRGSVVISATNGKTTTAGMLSSILDHAGIAAVHNRAGANMPGGIATALLDASGNGTLDGDLGLFEVDEAWTERIVGELRPEVIVLANLFRDQLDRYGELETLADRWRQMVEALPFTTRTVLNADDPLLASLGAGLGGALYFGLEDRTYAEREMRHAADSKFCRNCGAPLVYSAVQLGHLGDYHCESCGAARPKPDVAATKIELRGMHGSTIEIKTPTGTVKVDLPIPGLYNVYNAVAACAAAHALGIDDESISHGLAASRAAFGRVETIDLGGKNVAILLIKNPTGANEVIRTITAEQPPFDLWISLNDGIADGRDISWIWDAEFEQFAGKVRSVICSGTRADELALRMAYAGIDRSSIIVDDKIEQSFDNAVSGAVGAGTELFALPTYTSLLELRNAISRRGDAPSYWED